MNIKSLLLRNITVIICALNAQTHLKIRKFICRLNLNYPDKFRVARPLMQDKLKTAVAAIYKPPWYTFTSSCYLQLLTQYVIDSTARPGYSAGPRIGRGTRTHLFLCWWWIWNQHQGRTCLHKSDICGKTHAGWWCIKRESYRVCPRKWPDWNGMLTPLHPTGITQKRTRLTDSELVEQAWWRQWMGVVLPLARVRMLYRRPDIPWP